MQYRGVGGPVRKRGMRADRPPRRQAALPALSLQAILEHAAKNLCRDPKPAGLLMPAGKPRFLRSAADCTQGLEYPKRVRLVGTALAKLYSALDPPVASFRNTTGRRL